MKNFRVKLKMHFNDKNEPVLFIGKYNIDANGYIKGFLKDYNEDKPEFKKSYIIGIKDKQGNIRLAQVWVYKNGEYKFPASPVKYEIKESSKKGKWERIDRINDYEYFLWKLGKPGFENFNFSGTASIDIKKISENPLDETENEIISNVLDAKGSEIRGMLNLDSEAFQIMKEEMLKK
ncbi:MAG: hypothetical protein E7310_06100 [Clostridiales bacterium]|nr:hypothetical protein [Clostridiales bacterium]